MGKDSYSILHRRYKMKKYLIRVGTTNYKRLRQEFDVTYKVIVRDLEFINDELGVWIETKRGIDGYVRVCPRWYDNQIRLNNRQTRCLIKVFHMNIDEIDRDIILDILETYCNPELVKEIVDN